MTELLEHHLPAPVLLSFKELLFSTMVESKQSGPCQGMQSLSKAMEGACVQYLHHICLGNSHHICLPSHLFAITSVWGTTGFEHDNINLAFRLRDAK